MEHPTGFKLINAFVPITRFNKGEANKIFDEVKQSGTKVVLKNNAVECVLLSPEEYGRLVDEVNDARLLAVATDRLSHYDPETVISEEEMNARLGITADDLSDYEGVEIE